MLCKYHQYVEFKYLLETTSFTSERIGSVSSDSTKRSGLKDHFNEFAVTWLIQLFLREQLAVQSHEGRKTGAFGDQVKAYAETDTKAMVLQFQCTPESPGGLM